MESIGSIVYASDATITIFHILNKFSCLISRVEEVKPAFDTAFFMLFRTFAGGKRKIL